MEIYLNENATNHRAFPLFCPQLHSDGDRGDGSVRYVLTGEGAGTLFKIDEKSGDIHATKRLDREEKAYYILHAKAVNRFTNEALEGQSEFVIKIHDINDNEPRFTKDLYVARVPEMSDIGKFLKGAVLQLFHSISTVDNIECRNCVCGIEKALKH